MEHKMRRFKQMLDRGECEKILAEATNGVLSLVDADGEPYGVPLSFAYDGENHIYFHSATTGHKLDCLRHDSRCTFTVVAMDEIIPEKFTTCFRSVIVAGRGYIVDSPAELLKGLVLLGEKYSPGIDSDAEIAKSLGHVAVMRLDIDRMSGKEGIELVRQKADRQLSSEK